MNLSIGADIGGTHVAAGIVDLSTGCLMENAFYQQQVDAGADREVILEAWSTVIRKAIENAGGQVCGIGIAMPGPFDYENGISLIRGLHKYESLYGVNVKAAIMKRLELPDTLPVLFENDAACFALGESWSGSAKGYTRALSIALGTGFGSAFLLNGIPLKQGEGVPEGGMLYNIPYKDGTAEEYLSTDWFIRRYRRATGEDVQGVKPIYEKALQDDPVSRQVFLEFADQLSEMLIPWLRSFRAECLVIGGSISKAAAFFLERLKSNLRRENLTVDIMISKLNEKAATIGAAGLVRRHHSTEEKSKTGMQRDTEQFLLPLRPSDTPAGTYDIYPSFPLKEGKIYDGTGSLAEYIITCGTVIIDGYAGVFWDDLKKELKQLITAHNLQVCIQDTMDWLHTPEHINEMVKPYLGADDSVWGKKYDGALADFFDTEKIRQTQPDNKAAINILMGCGAALSGWDVPVIYIDIPKNELQFRMRAGSITNIGAVAAEDPVKMYKRFYFVDWVVLNRHKKAILPHIQIIADAQRPGELVWMYTDDLKKALKEMSENVFRARPWFEPGAWGGQWIKQHIPGINNEAINYAWSFELITPENGLLLEDKGIVLEVSFDLLMFLHSRQVLGERYAERFGDEFPIRFDFLDTVSGGNLSIQCHPRPEYIREKFGENFTQDETYYILDAQPDAGVYLGFCEDIDPQRFRQELEKSNEENKPVSITKYVQLHPARRHDLFLIPNGTIHSAAAGNLVLEISATPYIFTFKMYDWLRPDLNGKPRPINIEHAFNNLDFSRKGETVKKTLISQPALIADDNGWKLYHLPTHPDHFYDVHRYEFEQEVSIQTNGSCHVLMLVEGSSIMLETRNGYRKRFSYAETFVVPAAAESYTLINEGGHIAKVVKAFMK